MVKPLGEDTHGFAAGGVELGFAPGAGFGEAEAMEDADDEVDAVEGADEDDADGFAGGLIGGGWREVVGFGVGDEGLHELKL
ncbi:MAG: hypothetical protein AAFW84_00680 [Cyanobacteria bacterium J06635_15]